MALPLGAIFLNWQTVLRLAKERSNLNQIAFAQIYLVCKDSTSNNSFQFLINFSLVFKITLKVGVRHIAFQHKSQS